MVSHPGILRVQLLLCIKWNYKIKQEEKELVGQDRAMDAKSDWKPWAVYSWI